jgi:small subunit ribosomal protein S20
MANLKTAKQRIKTNERSRQRNMAVKSRMKSYIKAAEAALESGDTAAGGAAVQSALSEIDRAVRKGVVHPNSGARKKSYLQRRVSAKS